MNETLKALRSELQKHGYKFKIVSTEHLQEMKEIIERLRMEGRIGEKIYTVYLSFLQFEKPETLPEAGSIIILAIPQNITLVTFSLNGKKYEAAIPPTYIYGGVVRTCEAILTDVLEKTGARIVKAALPLKTLAVKSGLGRYGRNNICYVEGMGSFPRLQAFYTDYSFNMDSWQEAEMMACCASCELCLKNCPAGCITAGSFLIRAEKCLTLFNENPGDFPAWIDPESHNALVGCLKCQIICPENRSLAGVKGNREVFTEKETGMILAGTPQRELPKASISKLERLNMDEYYSVLPRNLQVLI